MTGFASVTVPIYIAETSPSAIRGRLVSLNQAFISGGMFVSLLVAGSFCSVASGWRYVLISTCGRDAIAYIEVPIQINTIFTIFSLLSQNEVDIFYEIKFVYASAMPCLSCYGYNA